MGGGQERDGNREGEEFRSLLRVPFLYLPTACLALSVIIVHLSVSYLYITGVSTNMYLTIAILYASSFASFTVLHDCIHCSVSSSRAMNYLVGTVTGIFLGPSVTFTAVRHIHLQHHKHTNVEGKDPDLFASSGPGFLLPFKWAAMDCHYYTNVLTPSQIKTFSKAALASIFIQLGLQFYAMYYFYQTGYFHEALVCWVIPSRFAIFTLAATFDYLPHSPHVVPITQSRYHTTALMVSHKMLTPLFTCLLLYQNYHIMHHLYPTIPFPRYKRAYECKKQELDEKKIPVRRLPMHFE